MIIIDEKKVKLIFFLPNLGRLEPGLMMNSIKPNTFQNLSFQINCLLEKKDKNIESMR